MALFVISCAHIDFCGEHVAGRHSSCDGLVFTTTFSFGVFIRRRSHNLRTLAPLFIQLFLKFIEGMERRIRTVRPISQIQPGIFIGDEKNTHDEAILKDNKISAVVSLVNAPMILWKRPRFTRHVRPGRHLWVECVDSSTQDLLVHMTRICDFIERMLSPTAAAQARQENAGESDDDLYQTLEQYPEGDSDNPGQPEQETPGGDSDIAPTSLPLNVLVHCERGVSRSPTAVIAYLMRKHRKSRDTVLAEVRAKRRIKPSRNFMNQLEVWEQVEYEPWEDEDKMIPKAPYKAFLEARAAQLKLEGLTGNEPIRPLNLGED